VTGRSHYIPASLVTPYDWCWASASFGLVAGVLVVFPLICLDALGLQAGDLPVLVWVSLVYLAVRLGLSAASGLPAPCAIMTQGWVYVFMVLAPGLSAATGRFPQYVRPSPEGVFGAEAIVLLGLIIFDLVYCLGWRSRTFIGALSRPVAVHPGRLLAILLGIWAVCLLMLPLVGVRAILPDAPALAGFRTAGIAQDSAGTGLAGMVLRNGAVAAFLLALWCHRGRAQLYPAPELRRRSRITLWYASLMLFVFANPLFLPRMSSLALLVAALIFGLPWRGRRASTAWAIALTIVVFFSFSALKTKRTIRPWIAGEITTAEMLESISSSVTGSMIGAPASELAEPHMQLAHGVDYYVEHRFSYGRSLLRIPLQWVPRSFWPSKPIPPGEVITRWVGNPSNVSSPLWLEGYADFGVYGAMVLLGLWAWVAGAADSRLRTGWTALRVVPAGIIVPFLAGNAGILLRGSLDAGLYRNGVGLLILYAALRFMAPPPAALRAVTPEPENPRTPPGV